MSLTHRWTLVRYLIEERRRHEELARQPLQHGANLGICHAMPAQLQDQPDLA